MSDVETRLRVELHAATDQLTWPTLDGASVRARSLAPTRNRTTLLRSGLAIAAAASVVLATVVVVRTSLDGVPNSGPVLSDWAPRGDAALLSTLGPRAQAVWDASLLPAAELPHHAVRPLYAAHTQAGDVVVLEGVDALGHHRTSVFGTDVTSKTAYRDRLHLLWDHPSPGRARLLAWDLPRPTPRPTDDRLLVVLASPGTDHVMWQGQDERSWKRLDTPGGVATLLHVTRGLDSFVRVGSHGHGLRIPMSFGQPDHLVDDEEWPKSDGSDGCSAGGVCQAHPGGGSLTAVGPGKSASADLRDDVARDAAARALQWDEMHAEVELGTESRRPGAAWTGRGAGSGLLPDGTGLALEKYSFAGSPERFALYVDRPSLPVGAFWYDKVITGPVPAVTVLVPRSAGGRWFAAVAAPATTVKVSWGNESWQVLSHHGDLCYLAVPATGEVEVMLVDPDGTIRHVGAVDSTRPLA
jgi:hypothetical protein